MKTLILKNKFNNVQNELKTESIENLQNYDVKNEITNCPEILNESDPAKKIINYKEKAGKEQFDCDVTLRASVIFQLAWDILRNRSEVVQQDSYNNNGYKYEVITDSQMILRGDTMNSFWTPFKAALQKNEPHYKQTCSRLGIKTLSKSINEHYHEFKLNNELKDLFNRFALLNHTIGNFIPVPKGFNTGREKLTIDYWDLTLYCISHWYSEEESYLKRLLGSDISFCEKWLSSFKDRQGKPSWKTFVDDNYLKAFVNASYEPIELFTDHFERFNELLKIPVTTDRIYKEMILNPQNNEEMVEFLKNVNQMIECRGITIAKKVKKVLENNI